MLEELATDKARTEIDKLSFKKVLWQTLNRLKREQRVCERNTDMNEAYDLGEEADWNNLVVLKQEVNKLSKMEQVIFYDHLFLTRRSQNQPQNTASHAEPSPVSNMICWLSFARCWLNKYIFSQKNATFLRIKQWELFY